MRPLRKIAFLLEEFTTPSPAQQLLDRFLIGYPRDGTLHKLAGTQIAAYLTVTSEATFGERPREFDLLVTASMEEAVADADAVIIVPRRPGALANESFLRVAVEKAPEGAVCFVYGVLANSLANARHLLRTAASRRIAVAAGTPLGVTWRLPPAELPLGTPLTDALIVVQLSPLAAQATPPSPPATLGSAALHALDGLLPVIERRQHGEAGIRSLRFLEGKDFWRAGEKGLWSWPLLAAALSRSHSPEGNAIRDGRTEDLVGLKLVTRLARNPRGWLLEHGDGLRTALLVLDGVVGDVNFAVRASDGGIVSAQLFRAPPPGEHHFSQLVAVMEDFFRSNRPPWPIERSLLVSGLLEIMGKPATLSGQRVETPALSIAYTVA